MLKKINEAVDFIKSQYQIEPEIGIILGTGLGELANEIKIEKSIPYKSIPNFPISTVRGHQGQLIFGTLSGRKIIAMQGRFHYYEGYSMHEVTFPIRVMKLLGIKLLVVSNASGGVNPNFSVGDIMYITDHVNLMPNPLIRQNIDDLGTRFPDMSEAYDKRIITIAQKVANELRIKVQQGVYAGTTGPTFETPSEYHYMRTIGADAVGMSTVPEVIVARHMKLPVFALSVISDLGGKDLNVSVTHEEVIEAASAVQPKMAKIIKALLEKDII